MTSTGEKVFPRGGKNPALSKKPVKAQKFSLFKKSSKKTDKKIEKKKLKKASVKKNNVKTKVKSINGDSQLGVKQVDDLNPTILHDGALVLGIVSQVSDKFVNVSLPGGNRGIVTLANVSQFYKDIIVNASETAEVPGLLDLFKVGDMLPVRVISVSENDKRKFYVSFDPKFINLKFNEMETGLVIVGSVKSEEDHGYIVDFGIPSVNGFLNYNKIENGEKLPVGKLVRCAVIKHINSRSSSNVELSLLGNDLKNAYLSPDSSCPIHSFVPGLQFGLTVTRVLKNGLEVQYMNDKSLKGFVHEDYLPDLFPKLNQIAVGTKYMGTLLYIKPLVNIPYFKVISYRPQNYIFQYGKIVRGKVMKTNKSGVFFRIGKKLIPMKCYVPLAKLAESKKIIDGDDSMDSLYPVGKIVEKIRLTKIDYMKRCYVGATNKMTVEEKYFSITDIRCGDIVPCKITSISESFVHVKIGNVNGMVNIRDLTDIPVKNPGARFKVGQKVTARVTDVDYNTLYLRLTMKPTLLDKELKILMNYNDVSKNECYTGTILKVVKSALIVTFFNKVIGYVQKNFTPHRDEPSLLSHYSPGHLVKCYVRQVSGTNLQLSLIPVQFCSLKVGAKYEVVVTSIESCGLIVKVVTDDDSECVTGTVPCELLCDYPGLGAAMLTTYSVNKKISAWHVLHEPGNLPVFAVSNTISRFYEVMANQNFEANAVINTGNIYPFIYRYFSRKRDRAILSPLIQNDRYKNFTVDGNNIFNSMRTRTNRIELPIKNYQMVYGKVLAIDGKNVDVSLKCSDVWNKDYRTSLTLLDSYLDSMKKLVNSHVKKREKYIRNVKLGSRVTSVVSSKSESVIYEVNNTVSSKKKCAEGEVISGTVVWIDGEKKLLCVNTASNDASENQDEEFEFVNEIYRARIVYVGDEVVVAALKGKGNGKMVFLPRKRHLNDFQNLPCPYAVGCLTKVWVERGKLNNLVAIDREVTLMTEKRIWDSCQERLERSIQSLKRTLPSDVLNGKMRKLNDNDSDMEIVDVRISRKGKVKEEKRSNSDDDIHCEYVKCNVNGHVLTDEIKQEVDADDIVDISGVPDVASVSEVDIKSENESDKETGNDKGKDIYSKERIFLSSSSESESEDDRDNLENAGETNLDVGFNWNVLNKRELLSGPNLKPAEESSSDDEDETKNMKRKRIRLTKSEKEMKAKEEEERLRLIEERLMKTDVEPETADDFDRALLANPNSSALWMKYMAFHLQATEIEKARAVARRAFKTIGFNEEQEKLNVWIAFLNLENLYGNEESFSKTLAEALIHNEPYHIHVHILNMHGQSEKFEEMEKVGNMLMKKFKDVENVWHDVGLAYYKVGRLEPARHVLQRALSVIEKKKHVELISKFAQMENKYGSSERAQTLYETVLASFPKRVDVWSCYVDMLVKSNAIDLARQVLERATSQNLPPKKMRTLFKKFLAFEENYGTKENVEKVRLSAVEYVEKVGAMEAM